MSYSILRKLSVYTLFTFLVLACAVKAQPIPPGTPLEQPDPDNWAMLRMFNECMAHIERRGGSDTVLDKLIAMRSYMANLPSEGNPISDRYVLTSYAGAVDMRHFMYAAIKVMTPVDSPYWRGTSSIDDVWYSFKVSDEIRRREGDLQLHIQRALYDTFCVEKGPEFEKLKIQHPREWRQRVEQRYWQATVEDLPSSALGALFAEHYLLNREDEANIVMDFTRFIIPFRPVPDDIRRELSHEEFVKGYFRRGDQQPTKEEQDELYIHFTAVPVINTHLINQIAEEQGAEPFCLNFDDPVDALAEAGVRVVDVAYKYPLRLEYIETAAKETAKGEDKDVTETDL